jgi:hypothetical protein
MHLKSITLKEFTKWKSLFIQYKPVVFYVRVSLVCWRVMYSGKNKFEVINTREQVHYEEENIMEFVLVT